MPTREYMSTEGQVITEEEIEATVATVVRVALDAIDESAGDVRESTRAKVKGHVAVKLGEALRRMIR